MPIGLTAKVIPLNGGFVGMVDANQVLGGGGSGVVPSAGLGTGTATSSNFLRGDQTWVAPTAAQVGAAAVSHVHAAADITSGTIATARLGSGTPDATTFLRGDQTWAVPASGGTPGGSDTQIQRNNAGAFGGVSGATSDGTTLTISSAGPITGKAGQALVISTPDAAVPQSVEIQGAAATSGTTTGAGVSFSAGTGSLGGAGGANVIAAGDGGVSDGPGGLVNIAGGAAGGGNASGGDVLLSPGGKTGAGTDGRVRLVDPTSGIKAVLDTSTLATSDKTFTFPNASGTLVIGGGTCSGASSGTNTGDQTITLTGDVTGTGTGSFAATIANGAVTLAKMANIATDRLIGRDTAATGAPEALTVSGGLEFTGSGGIQRSALTGDVTASAGSNTATLADKHKRVSFSWHLSASALVVGAEYAINIGPDAVTLAKVLSETDTGTVDFDIEERAFGSGETAGTAITTADMQTVDAGTTTTSFSNAAIAADSYLVLIPRVLGSTPGDLKVCASGLKD